MNPACDRRHNKVGVKNRPDVLEHQGALDYCLAESAIRPRCDHGCNPLGLGRWGNADEISPGFSNNSVWARRSEAGSIGIRDLQNRRANIRNLRSLLDRPQDTRPLQLPEIASRGGVAHPKRGGGVGDDRYG